jgi:uncharacterized membrane protein HdeD (DUF308 family)
MVSITLTLSAVFAIIAGIVVIFWPRILNYVVGVWLLAYGILQLLNGIF